MKKSERYNTSYLIEDQFEPGSRGRLLRNLLQIARKREMDVFEAEQYTLVQLKLMGMYSREHRFSAADICTIHREWLGDVYEWAGQFRNVNISKGDFTFAMARHVPQLMKNFEKDVLKKYTPCIFTRDDEIVAALAVVHTEMGGREDCFQS